MSRPSTSELDGSLSPGTAESLSLCIAVILSALVWCEHEVAIDDHTDREAGPDGTPADRGSIIVRRALPHGHVAAVLGTLRAIGLDRILGPAGNRPRDLVIAMIVARLIAPASKLATARMLDPATAASSLGDILGLGAVDEDELYAAIDWLGERQGAIEQAGIEYRDCAGLETVAFFVCAQESGLVLLQTAPTLQHKVGWLS